MTTDSSSIDVLVVEDEEAVRDLLTGALARVPANVTSAVDGQDGLEKYMASIDSGKPFPIVITDAVMPGINGAMLTRRIKEVNPQAVVYLVSGYLGGASEDLAAAPDNLLPNGIITKPYSPAFMMNLVRKIAAGQDHESFAREYEAQKLS